jgi:hypothetical protein
MPPMAISPAGPRRLGPAPAGTHLAGQRVKIAIEVHLHRVARRPDVAARVGVPFPLQLGLHDAGRRERVIASEMSRDQLRLRLSQRHRRPQRLQQANEEEVRLARSDKPQPERQVVPGG